MRSRSHLTSKQSKKFSDRKQARNIIIAAAVVISAVSWIYTLSAVTHIRALTIQSVKVYGADADITPNLEAAVLNSIQGNFLGLFSKSNTLLYPESAITHAVLSASPRILNLAIARDGSQGLAVTVKEKTPAALVCANLPDFSGTTLSFGDNDDCYFADSRGYIFATAPTFSGHVYNRYYIPGLSDASTTIIGEFATSTTEFDNLQTFYANLNAANIDTSAILMKDGGEYELYIHNPQTPTNNGTSTDSDLAVVYFNNSRPFTDQLLNLVSFWNKMTETARTDHQPLSFDYIDVRYGSNVFYRLVK